MSNSQDILISDNVYCAKNNVVQPFRLVYKSQNGSLGYNAHLIMKNGITYKNWEINHEYKPRK